MSRRSSTALALVATGWVAACSPGRDTGQASAVVATRIALDDRGCSKQGLPIALYLRNTSAWPVQRVGWSFSVSPKGHPGEIALFNERIAAVTDPHRVTHRPIQAGETIKVCSTAPYIQGEHLAQDLEYRVVVTANPTTL